MELFFLIPQGERGISLVSSCAGDFFLVFFQFQDLLGVEGVRAPAKTSSHRKEIK